MNDYATRPARSEDLEAASELLKAAGLPLDGFADHLTHPVIAMRSERMVGVVELEVYGSAALLRSLVAPSERGMGLGERLTTEALSLARGRGARDVYCSPRRLKGSSPGLDSPRRIAASHRRLSASRRSSERPVLRAP